jgi:hypothetical protein
VISRDTLRKAYAAAEVVPRGGIAICPVCSQSFRKTRTMQKFCTNKEWEASTCKDIYHNRVNPPKRGGRANFFLTRKNTMGQVSQTEDR